MGQKKGNNIPTPQQQAYIDKYGANAIRTNAGQTPAMIDSTTTLNSVIDSTFATDADVTGGTKDASFNTVTALQNGTGRNFKVGDDAYIGDINKVNTIVVAGIVNGDRGFIQFGSGSQPSIGHNGGGGLPAAGTATSGSILTTSGHLYFYNGTSGNGGWAQVI